jgi:hypothetical protein
MTEMIVTMIIDATANEPTHTKIWRFEFDTPEDAHAFLAVPPGVHVVHEAFLIETEV